MIESILAWGIQNGLDDSDLVQLIGAGIAFLTALAIFLHSKRKIGADMVERLRRIDRFWKEKFQPNQNTLTPPPAPEQQIRPIVEKPKNGKRDPRDITNGII